MKLKWPIILIAVVVIAFVAAIYFSTSGSAAGVENSTSQPANSTPLIIGVIIASIVALGFWQRRKILNALQGMGSQPPIMDWSCQVSSAQKMGEYAILISDSLNKSYVLDIGAVLCGMKIPKGSWRNVFEEIGEGSELKFRVLTTHFAESKSSAIPIVRLNSYTPKWPSSF